PASDSSIEHPPTTPHTLSLHDALPICDREWFACVRQGGGACGYHALNGAHTPRQPQTILEKARGILECLRLHILTQCEGHRAAVRRVSEYIDCAIERRDQLFRTGDAVEVAGHRSQAIVHGGEA